MPLRNFENIASGTDTSDATAVAANIASGLTAYTANGKETGTYVDYTYYARGLSAAYQGLSTGLTSYLLNVPNVTTLAYAWHTNTAVISIEITVTSALTTIQEICNGAHNLVTITIHGSTSSVANWNAAFSCSKLETINGALDMSTCTNSAMFSTSTTQLVNVSYVPNTINIAYSLANQPLLSNTSLLSLANGLVVQVTAKTITMHATSKTAMNAINVDNVDGTAVAGSAMTLTEFVTNIKNWTVA